MCIAQVVNIFINNRVTPQGCAPGKLEPLAGKLAWAVLRGHGGSNTALLPDFLENDVRIDVSKAIVSEKSLIQHMMQLYQYDFSEFEENDLDDHGLFSYKYLDHYWVEESRTPLIVRVEGCLAGFVFVNKHSYTTQERFCIAEFFIMRKYRRKGIGKEVAHRVFGMFGPLWEVQQSKDNTVAQIFWSNVVSEYSGGQFDCNREGCGAWKGPILTFKRMTKT